MSPLGLSSPDQNITITIVIIFPVVAFLVLCVRIAGRASSRQFGRDDGLACTAMVLSILETYFSFMFIKTNFVGINPGDIPRHDPTPGLMWNYVVQILYNPILGLVKGIDSALPAPPLRAEAQGAAVHLMGEHGECRPYGGGSIHYRPAVHTHREDVGLLRPGKVREQADPIHHDIGVQYIDGPLDPGATPEDLHRPKDPTAHQDRTHVLVLAWIHRCSVTVMSVIRMVLLIQGLFMSASSLDPDGNVGFATSAIETNPAVITASAPALRPLLRAWFPRLFGVTDRDQLAGNTIARRVLGTSAMGTRLTRMRSQHSRMVRGGGSPKLSEEEEAFPSALLLSNGILQRSVVHIHYEPNPGLADGSAFERRVQGAVVHSNPGEYLTQGEREMGFV
ncbi:hypothetical protein DL768_009527 [Monosporascus sp. mg162]|nr:hypothetical protein DL768_009527 [Monosporascus sp. mg162]